MAKKTSSGQEPGGIPKEVRDPPALRFVKAAPRKVPFFLEFSTSRRLLGCLENRSEDGVSLRAYGCLAYFNLGSRPASGELHLCAVYAAPPLLTTRLATELPVGSVVSFELDPVSKRVVDLSRVGYRTFAVAAEELYARHIDRVAGDRFRVSHQGVGGKVTTLARRQNVEVGVRVMLRCPERQVFVGPYEVSDVRFDEIDLMPISRQLRSYALNIYELPSQRYTSGSFVCSLADFSRASGEVFIARPQGVGASARSLAVARTPQETPKEPPADATPSAVLDSDSRNNRLSNTHERSATFVSGRLLSALRAWFPEATTSDARLLHENVTQRNVTVIPSIPWARAYQAALGETAIFYPVFVSPLWLDFADAWAGGLAGAWRLAQDTEAIVLVYLDQVDRSPSSPWLESLWGGNHGRPLPNQVPWPANLRILCTLARDQYAFPVKKAVQDAWGSQRPDLAPADSPSPVAHISPISCREWLAWGRSDGLDLSPEPATEQPTSEADGRWIRHCAEQEQKGESCFQCSSVFGKRAVSQILRMIQRKEMHDIAPTIRNEELLAKSEAQVRSLGLDPEAMYPDLGERYAKLVAAGRDRLAAVLESMGDRYAPARVSKVATTPKNRVPGKSEVPEARNLRRVAGPWAGKPGTPPKTPPKKGKDTSGLSSSVGTFRGRRGKRPR